MASLIPTIIAKLLYLLRGFCFNNSPISNSLMSKPDFFSTSHRMHWKKHGYRQLKKQQQYGGKTFELDSLQRSPNELKGESATMISHY
jgi:hypothetical protein